MMMSRRGDAKNARQKSTHAKKSENEGKEQEDDQILSFPKLFSQLFGL
jgi:hypothetical protein